MECRKCYSDDVIRHGIGRKGSQRMLCKSCHVTFTPGGVRGTYAQDFINTVVQQYCHDRMKAQDIVHLYNISTRTLIKWSKQHKKDCQSCAR